MHRKRLWYTIIVSVAITVVTGLVTDLPYIAYHCYTTGDYDLRKPLIALFRERSAERGLPVPTREPVAQAVPQPPGSGTGGDEPAGPETAPAETFADDPAFAEIERTLEQLQQLERNSSLSPREEH